MIEPKYCEECDVAPAMKSQLELGSEPKEDFPVFWLECPTCGEMAPCSDTQEGALERWNSGERVDDTPHYDYGDDHSHF